MSYIPASDSQYILSASGTTINPATDETVQLLRRMVKILDSIATVDVQNRQRVTLDAANTAASVTVAQATATNLNATVAQPTAANLNANVSQPTAANLNATVVQATATNLNATVVQATAANLNANIGTIASVDGRYQFIEAARVSYATGVRPNLKFT